MSVIIGADIVPVKSNIELFEKAQTDELLGGELRDLLNEADFRIFNLEVPLTDQQKPIAKYGPHLIASTACVAGIKAMGIDLLTLANNHIMDHDVQGLVSTVHALDNAGISHVGAGSDIEEAQKPYFFSIKGVKYGVYACVEHEFSIAGEKKPGANPFDPLESLDHVAQMKSQCDYAIVLYHGGKEHYRYPSPYLQKVCRRLVKKGADLVVCQHSHCIGCKEDYQGGTIVYGQGNFLFDGENNEYWDTSLLLKIDDSEKIEFIPLCKKGNGVRLAAGKEAEGILNAFYARSLEITQPGCIEEKYDAFANESLPGYILYFLGLNSNYIYRVINKLSGHRIRRSLTRKWKKDRAAGMRNYIECEAHRELLLRGLKDNENT